MDQRFPFSQFLKAPLKKSQAPAPGPHSTPSESDTRPGPIGPGVGGSIGPSNLQESELAGPIGPVKAGSIGPAKSGSSGSIGPVSIPSSPGVHRDIKECIKNNFLAPLRGKETEGSLPGGGKRKKGKVEEKKEEELSEQKLKEDFYTLAPQGPQLGLTAAHTQEFQEKMRQKMGHHAFCAYVENKLTLGQVDKDYLCLFVPGPFNKLMLEKHYQEEIRQSVEELFGNNGRFEIRLDESLFHSQGNPGTALEQTLETAPEQRLTKAKRPKIKAAPLGLDVSKGNPLPGHPLEPLAQLQEQIDSQVIDRLDRFHGPSVIDKTKGLDNFIVGPSNTMAYAVCMTVSERPGEVYHSLYIQSSTGLGKTHLLHGIAGLITQKRPDLRVILTNARDFMSEMMESMAKKSIKDFRIKYSEKVDVLLIDDIHEIRNRPGTQNEIAHIFNEFIQNSKQLVFTSNRPPKEIEGLDDRVLTRLTGGLIVDIQRPDYETRTSIVKQKAKEEDVFFPNQVIQLLAQNYLDNIRELEGAIVRLAAFSNIMKVDIDLDVAKEQLKITQDLLSEKNLDIKKITKIVGDHYQIPVTDLRSKARVKHLVTPRHLAMFLAQKHLKATLMEIGEYFSNRDHTSIIHGIRKIQQQLIPNTELYFALQDIEKILKK